MSAGSTAAGRRRTAQPPHVHRRSRRPRGPAQLLRPGPGTRRLEYHAVPRLRHRRTPAARRRQRRSAVWTRRSSSCEPRPGWRVPTGTRTGGRHRVGVPVTPFPSGCAAPPATCWPRSTRAMFAFDNAKPRTPHEAQFFHATARKRGKPLAVAARFVLACTAGHLDEFPYRAYVHRGRACPKAPHPRLRMEDRGGNLGANVEIECVACGEQRNIREAMGERGGRNLPRCRGRQPHLGDFEPERLRRGAEAAGGRRVQPVVRADPVSAGRAQDRGERAGRPRSSSTGRPRSCSRTEMLQFAAHGRARSSGVRPPGPTPSCGRRSSAHRGADRPAAPADRGRHPDLRTRMGDLLRRRAARRPRRLRPVPDPAACRPS